MIATVARTRASIFGLAVYYGWLVEAWDLRTHPGPIPEALTITETSIGKVTTHRIPPRLRFFVPWKGHARRPRR